MTWLLFAGDMLVMAFMILVVVWVSLGMSDGDVGRVARLPLEEDERG